MKRRNVWTGLCIGLSALVCALAPYHAYASSHREAPAISRDPSADNTDVYAWVNKTAHDKLYIVGNWIPLEEPSGGPNFHSFSDNVRYEFNIARGGTSLEEVVSYYVYFRTQRPKRVAVSGKPLPLFGGHQFFSQLSGQKQTYSVLRIKWNKFYGVGQWVVRDKEVAPANIGPRTAAVVYKAVYGHDKYDNNFIKSKFIHKTNEGGQVFAGPRDDPFFVDLGGVFDLANLRAKGTAQDTVSGYNTHSIALEIPTKTLTANGQPPKAGASAAQTLAIWCSSSRRRKTIRYWNGRVRHRGYWVQVSRLGFPLINEAIIGLQDKDRFNASHPAWDAKRFGAYFLNPVIVQNAKAVGILKDITSVGFNRTDILDVVSNKLDLGTGKVVRDIKTVGDVLRVDMGTDSAFPNGRGLKTDVVDILLSYILTKKLSGVGDGVDKNDVPLLNEFPFLALPHDGRDGGHGKVPQ